MTYIRNDPNRRRQYKILAAGEDANQIILAAQAEARRILKRAEQEAERQERIAYELGTMRARANRDARRLRAERPKTITINYDRLDQLAAGQP